MSAGKIYTTPRLSCRPLRVRLMTWPILKRHTERKGKSQQVPLGRGASFGQLEMCPPTGQRHLTRAKLARVNSYKTWPKARVRKSNGTATQPQIVVYLEPEHVVFDKRAQKCSNPLAWLILIRSLSGSEACEASAEVHKWRPGDRRRAKLAIGRRRPQKRPPEMGKGVGADKQVQLSFGCFCGLVPRTRVLLLRQVRLLALPCAAVSLVCCQAQVAARSFRGRNGPPVNLTICSHMRSFHKATVPRPRQRQHGSQSRHGFQHVLVGWCDSQQQTTSLRIDCLRRAS